MAAPSLNRIWGAGDNAEDLMCATAPADPRVRKGAGLTTQPCSLWVCAGTLSAEDDFWLNLQLDNWEALCCPGSGRWEWLLSCAASLQVFHVAACWKLAACTLPHCGQAAWPRCHLSPPSMAGELALGHSDPENHRSPDGCSTPPCSHRC